MGMNGTKAIKELESEILFSLIIIYKFVDVLTR